MISLRINGILTALSWVNFSDGASWVRIDGATPVNPENAIITCISDGSPHDNLFNIGQVLDVVRGLNPRIKTTLFMPYTPYARADRNMVKKDSFGMQVFARSLNVYNFDEVIIIDPHSDVAPALINNCKVVTQAQVLASKMANTIITGRDYLVVAPDAGSLKKIGAVSKLLGADVAVLGKDRNVETGTLSKTRILEGDVAGRDCLIVDDICDGGGTFIAAAECLLSAGAASVSLYVTHGIFSKGVSVLKKAGFTNIFTTDSINVSVKGDSKEDHSGFVIVFRCLPIMADLFTGSFNED